MIDAWIVADINFGINFCPFSIDLVAVSADIVIDRFHVRSSCKEVEQFSKKFAVEQDLVQAYIAYLQDLKIQSNIRARGRIEQKNKRAQKTVEEYAWLELVQSGNIKKTTCFRVGKISKTLQAVKQWNKS